MAVVVGRGEKAGAEEMVVRLALVGALVPDMAGQAGRVAAGALVVPGMGADRDASADAGGLAVFGTGQAEPVGDSVPLGRFAVLAERDLGVLAEEVWDGDIDANAGRNHSDSRYPTCFR
jgi:hypothetical protein